MRDKAPKSFGLSKLWVSENLGNEAVKPILTCGTLFHRFLQQNMYLIRWFLLVQSVLRIYKEESMKVASYWYLVFAIVKRPSNCKTNDCVRNGIENVFEFYDKMSDRPAFLMLNQTNMKYNVVRLAEE